jgi:deoxycytidylate deaminase
MRRDKAIKFMRQAISLADEFSKDSSTKVGAIVVDPTDFTKLTEGYNGMPRKVQEDIPERLQRPLKYAFFEHAERNSTYNLARQTLKGSLAVSTIEPSPSCARALASVGAREVYYPVPRTQTLFSRVVTDILREAGTKIIDTNRLRDAMPRDRHVAKMAQYLRYLEALPAILGKDPEGSATLFLSAEDYTHLAEGYSGLPRGADDTRQERYLGEMRDIWVESSVRNAIYNTVRPKLKGAVGLVTATTCVECARGWAGVGLSQIWYCEPSDEFLSRWRDNIEEALKLLAELGVETIPLSKADLLLFKNQYGQAPETR